MRIRRIIDPLTPYLGPTRSLASVSFLIALIRSGVNFLSIRCFLRASVRLSSLVPRNMCSGLQQSLLSHLWQISRPFGIDPLCSSHATLWAKYLSPVPGHSQVPYGALPSTRICLLPCQYQHPDPSCGCTRSQKDALGLRLVCTAPLPLAPQTQVHVLALEEHMSHEEAPSSNQDRPPAAVEQHPVGGQAVQEGD